MVMRAITNTGVHDQVSRRCKKQRADDAKRHFSTGRLGGASSPPGSKKTPIQPPVGITSTRERQSVSLSCPPPTIEGAQGTAAGDSFIDLKNKEQHDRFVAVLLNRNFLGAACIDSNSGKLSVLGRTACPPHQVRELLSLLFATTSPTRVIVSSKANEDFTVCLREVLRRHRSYCGSDEESARNTTPPRADEIISVLPNSAWDIKSCQKRLAALDFNGLVLGPQGHASLRRLALPALLDMTNTPSVQAVGALLHHVSKAMLGSWSPAAVEMLDLRSFMFLDKETLRSLDILRCEEHPSVIRGRGRQKEGFSIMTLLDRCSSSAGRKILRSWLLKPLANVRGIEERHNAVQCLLEPGFSEMRETLSKHLRDIKDVPRAILRIKRVSATAKDWIALAESLTAIILVQDLAQTMLQNHIAKRSHTNSSQPQPQKGAEVEPKDHDRSSSYEEAATVPIFRAIVSEGKEELSEIQQMLSVVDWVESKTSGRVCVVEGFDEHLDSLRTKLSKMNEMLEKVTKTDLPRVYGAQFASQMEVQFFPQVGFVIAMCEVRPILPPDDFEAIFRDKAPPPLRVLDTRNCAEWEAEEALQFCATIFGSYEETLKHFKRVRVLIHALMYSQTRREQCYRSLRGRRRDEYRTSERRKYRKLQ